jgi:hypothetical protein
MKIYKIFSVLSVSIALLFSLNPAEAFVYKGYRWHANPTLKVASNMGSTGSCSLYSNASWRNDFNCAVAAWNGVDSSYRTILVSTNNENDTDKFDGENEVAWDSGISGNTLGNTWTFHLGNEIYESDITFNPSPSSGKSWVSGSPPPSAYHYDQINVFRAISLHELGHFLGLDHDNNEPSIMNGSHPFGGWYRGEHYNNFNNYRGLHWPHADDVQGVNHIYPHPAVGRDLAILRARSVGTSSADDLTPVFPNATAATSACHGDFLRIRYTVQNRGNEVISQALVYAYLSTNLWISTSDIKSASGRAHSLAPFESETVQHDFYLPSSSLPAGNYYVGVYVDPDDIYAGEKSASYNNSVHLQVGNTSNDRLTITSCQ